jgi:hypothetical protein
MAKSVLGIWDDKPLKGKDDDRWREPRSGPYGLWCLISEPGTEERSTTDKDLGQVWVLGNLRPHRYSEPLRNFELLVEAAFESPAATQLSAWGRERRSVNIGLSQRGTSYSLEQVQVLEAREHEIPIKDTRMKWFKVHVVAGYELADDGAEQWPGAKKRLEDLEESFARERLYAYDVYPDET